MTILNECDGKVKCVKVKSDRKKANAKLKNVNMWLKANRARMKPQELIARLNQSLVGYYNVKTPNALDSINA